MRQGEILCEFFGTARWVGRFPGQKMTARWQRRDWKAEPMTTKTRLAKLAALALASAIALPAMAGAVVLPDLGPIPTMRPDASAASLAVPAAPQPAREVIQISTTAQEIPDARRDVRVVGANFLPDASEEIDFAAASEQNFAAVGYAEWFVMTTVQRMFETPEEDGTLQLASNEVQ
jgi:hypothetical protein